MFFTAFFSITTCILSDLKGFIKDQFLIISWNKLLDNIISRNYMLILLRIIHEFNQDWLNLYQTEIGTFHPLCLTRTGTQGAARSCCCLARKLLVLDSQLLMRGKSQLLMPNPEKTHLIKYKIFLVLKPIIQTLISPSRVNTVLWDFKRVTRGL